MKVSHLDHLVLTVADIEISCQFYQSALNFEVITFGENRKALKFGNQKSIYIKSEKSLNPKQFIRLRVQLIYVLLPKHH